MKIITLCGSLKFQKEMMEVAEKIALEGKCVLTPVYHVMEDNEINKEQILKLKEEHLKRIEISDSILVLNVNNYNFNINLIIFYFIFVFLFFIFFLFYTLILFIKQISIINNFFS